MCVSTMQGVTSEEKHTSEFFWQEQLKSQKFILLEER